MKNEGLKMQAVFASSLKVVFLLYLIAIIIVSCSTRKSEKYISYGNIDNLVIVEKKNGTICLADRFTWTKSHDFNTEGKFEGDYIEGKLMHDDNSEEDAYLFAECTFFIERKTSFLGNVINVTNEIWFYNKFGFNDDDIDRIKRLFDNKYDINTDLNGQELTITLNSKKASIIVHVLVLVIITIFIFLVVIPFFIKAIIKYNLSKCSLGLYDNSIKGKRKKILSSKSIDLPIEKVDSILISKSILDFLRGGKTIVIRSNSGVIRFPWVHNAEEFMQATLAEIEKYKKNVAQQTPAPQAPVQVVEKDNSATEKMRELKTMLDEGFITQEEFDAKRKEFLDKM